MLPAGPADAARLDRIVEQVAATFVVLWPAQAFEQWLWTPSPEGSAIPSSLRSAGLTSPRFSEYRVL